MKKTPRQFQDMVRNTNKPQLNISFDNAVITAGSPVSGIVDVELNRPTIIDAIKIGYISPERKKEREWHVHVDMTTMLFEGKKGAVSGTVYDVPLPPSFDDSPDWYVRYEIVVVADLPGKEENISVVRDVIVMSVTPIHSFDPGWNNLSRLTSASSEDKLIFTYKKDREKNLQDGSSRQINGIFRSFIRTESKSIQIPTKLHVNLANDGEASIMERLKVNKLLWIDERVDFRLISMIVVMKSITSRLTDIERPMSVANDILYQGNALDIPLRAESASDSLESRLDPHVFTDLDIAKI
ncbi:hypothetical protein V1517DRAFT_376037 [Lipomyces orientalis]|uniref:Uncharacterized protein n=1 Tax=Lipomyces orientalis TaxID=1233043 RepID=A0ACC3TFR5_9ASCO